ncbi:HNH endonuclease [Polaribacter sp.]|uniref:HNH endonuclease n=1 Tax=Polaribacter sp. TaxID=1920175 RepID=UPI003F6C1AD6
MESKSSRKIFFIKRKKEYLKYLNSKEWKEKRDTVLKLRGRSCERCKANLKGKIADIHHKTYKNIFNEKLDDLEILCRKCHKKEHNKKTKKKKLRKTKQPKTKQPKTKQELNLKEKNKILLKKRKRKLILQKNKDKKEKEKLISELRKRNIQSINNVRISYCTLNQLRKIKL